MEQRTSDRPFVYLVAWAVIVVLTGILSFQVVVKLSKHEREPLIISSTQLTATPSLTTVPSPTVISKTVLQLIQNDPQLSEFNTILSTTGWATTLATGEGYTVFAPTNQALTKLTTAQRTNVLGESATKSLQQQFVAQYIVKRQVTAGDLLEITSLTNVLNQRITVGVETSQVALNSNVIVENNEQQGTNGYLYRVTGLLFK